MADMDRTIMMGKLAGLKESRARLRLKIEGLCSGIRTGLNTMVMALDDLDIAQTSQQMDELYEAHVDYLDTVTQIQRLEKALHG